MKRIWGVKKSKNDTIWSRIRRKSAQPVMPTVMVWVGAVVPLSFRGRFSSYLGTFGFIGQFLSPILFAPVFMLMGLRGVFLAGAGVGAIWSMLLISGLGSGGKIKNHSKGA